MGEKAGGREVSSELAPEERGRKVQPRALAIEEAALRVDRVLDWTDSRAHLMLPPELGSVRLAWCHRQESILRVADRLQGLPEDGLFERGRALWRIKGVLQDRPGREAIRGRRERRAHRPRYSRAGGQAPRHA
jgi:hypothetical protein